MQGVEKREFLVYDGQVFRKVLGDVVSERALEIFLNERKMVTIAYAGRHKEELAAGYLAAEGLIASGTDIARIDVRDGEDRVHVYTAGPRPAPPPDGCDVLTISSSGARGTGTALLPGMRFTHALPRFPGAAALELMEAMLSSAHLHEASHGTHCAALAGSDGIVVSREDIGRHNTIDMLRGHALLHALDCTEKIVLTTGRVSAEIVIKVWKMGVPVIISHAAPTAKACRLLEEAGMTLIGYVRGGRMNVYVGEERVMV
jgi:FdhD protein